MIQVLLYFNTRNGFYVYKYNPSESILHVWNLFMFTYINGNIKVFVNVCYGEPFSSLYNGRYSNVSSADSAFYIGILLQYGKAHGIIDELIGGIRMWYL